MKRLTLLRHAKSDWDDPVSRDFDRPLNGRGQRAAVTVGTHAATLDLGIDYIIASPAVRVVETLDAFLPAAGLDEIEPHWDRRIYLASGATLIDVASELPDSADHALMSGHNPGLEDLILDLTTTGDPHRRTVEHKYPTAALATLVFAIDRWSDMPTTKATIERLILPRELDPALGPDAR